MKPFRGSYSLQNVQTFLVTSFLSHFLNRADGGAIIKNVVKASNFFPFLPGNDINFSQTNSSLFYVNFVYSTIKISSAVIMQ